MPLRLPRPFPVLSIALTAALLSVAGGRTSTGQSASSPGEPGGGGTYVGAAACGACHSTIHEKWSNGRHSKMVQPATSAAVEGDFSKKSVTLRGRRYTLRAEDNQFFISESTLTGVEQEHRVDYTLGSRRIQHYLTTLDKGWLVVLPPSWDVQRHEWFDNMDIVRPDEDEKKRVQQWNRNCFGCHVSREEKNYDPATGSYATRWMDFGTNCERCHGPGGRHVERYAQKGQPSNVSSSFIVRPTALDPNTSSMICAQCHSLRDVVAPEYKAGDDYYDYFMPLLEYGPRREGDFSYWPDGRPRRFSNDAIGLWESQCYLRGGATCTTCHADPHEPDVDRNAQLAATNNALCTRCHQEIGGQVVAHTRHTLESAGSSCVECHMPKTVVSIKSTMRDHTISTPAPENTVAFGIPNACTECHRDKRATWAVTAIQRWWPEGRRARLVARAKTFSEARAGRRDAIDGLIAIAGDDRQGPVIQANALGYLRKFNDPRAVGALVAALGAGHPVMRAVAASGLGEGGANPTVGVRAGLAAALDDPKRAVRISALISIINSNAALEPGDEARFRRVGREFMVRGREHPDDAGTQRDVGVLHLMTSEFDLAAGELEGSLRLDDTTSTKFLLALARIGQRRLDEARALLKQVPKSDPYYGSAVERLHELEPR